jgi:hypothetical protein
MLFSFCSLDVPISLEYPDLKISSERGHNNRRRPRGDGNDGDGGENHGGGGGNHGGGSVVKEKKRIKREKSKIDVNKSG